MQNCNDGNWDEHAYEESWELPIKRDHLSILLLYGHFLIFAAEILHRRIF